MDDKLAVDEDDTKKGAVGEVAAKVVGQVAGAIEQATTVAEQATTVAEQATTVAEQDAFWQFSYISLMKLLAVALRLP
ncbi:hypothetical protein L3X38_037580 [Prunus dulcis]|uniref:Uncharacterized protein n=1 Tax=Prunus dulcis TaxID=3755 RepID=A0AAD4YRD3_PRUDU|nr:hypothetical protein L3X38_037580 [Prunus dulcis]